MSTEKVIIGRDEIVDFVKDAQAVPAKIDTGADGSAVWASDIFVDEDHVLHFKLFGKSSKYYTGKEHSTKDFTVAVTKSSHGDTVLRYCTKLSIRIAGKRIRANFGLSNRSTHNYPILIGRRTLNQRFIVDVSKSKNLIDQRKEKTAVANDEMRKNPYKFYKETYLNGAKK